MRAFLVSFFLASVLAVNAGTITKNIAKRGFLQPQQHAPVHFGGGFVQGHGGHGHDHGPTLGHGFAYGNGGHVQGAGSVFSGHGLSVGYGNGFGHGHHRQPDNVGHHVVKVAYPIAQPAYIPAPVHVSHPVAAPVFLPEANHGHSAVGGSFGLPTVHKHIPFKSNFGSYEVPHESAISTGHFNGHLGGHVGSTPLALPTASYGKPVGHPVLVPKPTQSYGIPSGSYVVPSVLKPLATSNGESGYDNGVSTSYGTPVTDLESGGHGSGSFGGHGSGSFAGHDSGSFAASLAAASSSSDDDGYSYPVPSKKFF